MSTTDPIIEDVAYGEATGIDPETARVMREEAPVEPTEKIEIQTKPAPRMDLPPSALHKYFTDKQPVVRPRKKIDKFISKLAGDQHLLELVADFDRKRSDVEKKSTYLVDNPAYYPGEAQQVHTFGAEEKPRYIQKRRTAQEMREEINKVREEIRPKWAAQHKALKGKDPEESQYPEQLQTPFWRQKDVGTGRTQLEKTLKDKPHFFKFDQWTDVPGKDEEQRFLTMFSKGTDFQPSKNTVDGWKEKYRRVKGSYPPKHAVEEFKATYEHGHRVGGLGKAPDEKTIQSWINTESVAGRRPSDAQIKEFKKVYEYGRSIPIQESDLKEWRLFNSPRSNVVGALANHFTDASKRRVVATEEFRAMEEFPTASLKGDIAEPGLIERMTGGWEEKEREWREMVRRKGTAELWEKPDILGARAERRGSIAFAEKRPDFMYKGEHRTFEERGLAEFFTFDINIPGAATIGIIQRINEAVTGDNEYVAIGGDLKGVNIGRTAAEIGPAILDTRNHDAALKGSVLPMVQAYEDAGNMWSGDSKAGDGWMWTGWSRLPGQFGHLVAFPIAFIGSVWDHITSTEEYEQKWQGAFELTSGATVGGIGATAVTALKDYPKAWEEEPLMLALMAFFGANMIAKTRGTTIVKAFEDKLSNTHQFRKEMRQILDDGAKNDPPPPSTSPDPRVDLGQRIKTQEELGTYDRAKGKREVGQPEPPWEKLSPAAREYGREMRAELTTRPSPRTARAETPRGPLTPLERAQRNVDRIGEKIAQLGEFLKTARPRAKNPVKRQVGQLRKKLRAAKASLKRAAETKGGKEAIELARLRTEPGTFPAPRTPPSPVAPRHLRAYYDGFGREWVFREPVADILSRVPPPEIRFLDATGEWTHPKFQGFRELTKTMNRMVDQAVLRIDGPGALDIFGDNYIVFDMTSGAILSRPFYERVAMAEFQSIPNAGMISLRWERGGPQAIWGPSPIAGARFNWWKPANPRFANYTIEEMATGPATGRRAQQAAQQAAGRAKEATLKGRGGGFRRFALEERALVEKDWFQFSGPRAKFGTAKPGVMREAYSGKRQRPIVTPVTLSKPAEMLPRPPLEWRRKMANPSVANVINKMKQDLPLDSATMASMVSKSIAQYPKSIFGRVPIPKPIEWPNRMATHMIGLGGKLPAAIESAFRLASPLLPFEVGRIMYNRLLRDKKGWHKLRWFLRSPEIYLKERVQAVFDEHGRLKSKDSLALVEGIHSTLRAIPEEKLPLMQHLLDFEAEGNLVKISDLAEIAPVDPVTGIRGWGNYSGLKKHKDPRTAVLETKVFPGRNIRGEGKYQVTARPTTPTRPDRPMGSVMQDAALDARIDAARAYEAVQKKIVAAGPMPGYSGIAWKPRKEYIVPDRNFRYIDPINGVERTYVQKGERGWGAFEIDPDLVTLFTHGGMKRSGLQARLETYLEHHNLYSRQIGKVHERVRGLIEQEALPLDKDALASLWIPQLYERKSKTAEWFRKKFKKDMPSTHEEVAALRKQFDKDTMDLFKGPSAQMFMENKLRELGVSLADRKKYYGLIPDPYLRAEVGYKKTLYVARRQQMTRDMVKAYPEVALDPAVVPNAPRIIKDLSGKSSTDVVARAVDGRELYYFGDEPLYVYKDTKSPAKKHGAFAGKFVDADLARLLYVQEKMAEAASTYYAGMVRYLKGTKTFMDPGTTLRNLYTNVFLYAPLAGIHWLDPYNIPLYAKGLKDFVLGNKSKEFREAVKDNVFNKDFVSTEVTYNAKVRVLEGIFGPGKDITFELLDMPRKMLIGDFGGIGQAMKKTFWEYPGMLYGTLDNFFRYVAYLKYRKDGIPKWAGLDSVRSSRIGLKGYSGISGVSLSRKDAALLANKAFLDYSMVPGFVNYLRSPSDLGGKYGTMAFSYLAKPFITYSVKAVPHVETAFRNNPMAAMLQEPLWELFTEVGASEAGVDRDVFNSMSEGSHHWETLTRSAPFNIKPVTSDEEMQELLDSGMLSYDDIRKKPKSMPYLTYDIEDDDGNIVREARAWDSAYMNFGPYIPGSDYFPRPPAIGTYGVDDYLVDTILAPQLPPLSSLWTLAFGKVPVTGQRRIQEGVAREVGNTRYLTTNSTLRAKKIVDDEGTRFVVKDENEESNTLAEGRDLYEEMSRSDQDKFFQAAHDEDIEPMLIPMMDLGEEGSRWSGMADFLGLTAEELTPSWTPFVGRSWKKYMAAKEGRPDAFGRLRTMMEVLTNDLGGIKLERHNTKEQQIIHLKLASRVWKEQRSAVSSKMSKLGYKSGSQRIYEAALASPKVDKASLAPGHHRYMNMIIAEGTTTIKETWGKIKYLPQEPYGAKGYSHGLHELRNLMVAYLKRVEDWKPVGSTVDWQAYFVRDINRIFAKMNTIFTDSKLEDFIETNVRTQRGTEAEE